MNENKFDADKYKWRGLNLRVGKGYFGFIWRLKVIKGANFREFHWLWWKLAMSWIWNAHAIWNDGWDAHFRDTMYKDEVIESTKIYNRKN